ncbi:general secretion pathway protein GspK [Psychromonas sp. RZ22]|uniref:type II secretion system minor pseudopilin GspK n=1 Tax=Psychromonas algarum TaxID=2555643 RepID=UPI001068A3A1|nr:type II secretion system minor pseudopilin GspK [Psychromonas sp. RZ22]TEW53940.1 general secretion pathway protein GspK [Psychromonas sp. RZ22]
MKKQRGIALITVLMILALMVTIATTMTGRMTASLLRTEGLSFSQKVYWYGQASVEFSRMILNNDMADSSVVSLDQLWATPDMVFPVDEGTIAGRLKDYRSCFNVNAIALADKDDVRALPVRQFQALLEALDVEQYTAEVVAESTRDWIDKNDTVDGSQGAEDRIYEARGVAHLTANNLMVDISELRSVQGVSRAVFEHIKPYLCALPVATQLINVNTVAVDQAEILYALFKPEFNFSIEDFEQLLEDRPTSGWATTNEFLESPMFIDQTIPEDIKSQLSVTSEFFHLYGVAEFDDRLMALKLLFKIEDKKATTVRFQYAGIE